MSAAAAKAKSAAAARMAELFPPMRLREKAYVLLICCALLAPAIILGWRVVGPRDPYAAVTLVYHDNPLIALVALVLYAAVGSSVATLLMRGRLTDFGVFAVGVGLAGLALRGGDLTVLLQYEAGSAGARAGVFGSLAVDVLLWTIVPAISLAACAITEARAGLTIRPAPKRDKDAKRGQLNVSSRWLRRAAARTGAAPDWPSEIRQGLLTLIVTGVVAMVVIRGAAGRADGPVHAGQVCFAIGVGFWLGALAAGQFGRPALGMWVCLAVPAVALVGYLFASARPELSGELRRYTEIAIIAPNALARGLPVDYLAIGPAAAVLGTWTAQRLQRIREEAAGS